MTSNNNKVIIVVFAVAIMAFFGSSGLTTGLKKQLAALGVLGQEDPSILGGITILADGGTRISGAVFESHNEDQILAIVYLGGEAKSLTISINNETMVEVSGVSSEVGVLSPGTIFSVEGDLESFTPSEFSIMARAISASGIKPSARITFLKPELPPGDLPPVLPEKMAAVAPSESTGDNEEQPDLPAVISDTVSSVLDQIFDSSATTTATTTDDIATTTDSIIATSTDLVVPDTATSTATTTDPVLEPEEPPVEEPLASTTPPVIEEGQTPVL